MKKYRLENDFIIVEFLDLGATITRLEKKYGVNYILSYEDQNAYLNNQYYFGSIIGRNGGRTYPNSYTSFNDKQVILDQNENENHLHGGSEGFHQKYWNVQILGNDYAKLSMYDNSRYYEDAYFEIRFILIKNTFTIQIRGESLVPTVMNLTNHMYFNLNPAKVNICDHELYIRSKYVQDINEKFVPSKVNLPVYDEEFNYLSFDKPKKIKEAFDKNHYLSKLCLGGIDLAYVTEGYFEKPIIILSETTGENSLIIHSDQQAVVCYTLNKVDKDYNMKINQDIQKHQGITFEMQQLPNYTNILDEYLTDNYFSITKYTLV